MGILKFKLQSEFYRNRIVVAFIIILILFVYIPKILIFVFGDLWSVQYGVTGWKVPIIWVDILIGFFIDHWIIFCAIIFLVLYNEISLLLSEQSKKSKDVYKRWFNGNLWLFAQIAHSCLLFWLAISVLWKLAMAIVATLTFIDCELIINMVSCPSKITGSLIAYFVIGYIDFGCTLFFFIALLISSYVHLFGIRRWGSSTLYPIISADR